MNCMNNNTTIAAISTALTPSGVGIIRVSGSKSYDIINKIFVNKNKKLIKIDETDTHRIHYGFIYDPKNDKVLDEVLVLTFKTPKSFTGEDVIEIQTHGGVLVLKNILNLVLSVGAVLAEPGEFTKRAFLNGRLDLSQAEAVIDIINSENNMAIDASLSQLKGNLKNKIAYFKDALLENTAYIEACLDDPEHMSIDGYKEKLLKNVESIDKEVKDIIKNYDNGRIIKEGIKTVILGAPNAGKSSLLNTLLNENRAIVSDIAGTTRDTIEETITLDGISLKIIDTAGLRDEKKADEIEKIGIEKAKNAAKDADLILYVIDSSKGKEIDLKECVMGHCDESSGLENKKIIKIYNKVDLKKIKKDGGTMDSIEDGGIAFSTITKEGLAELKEKIKEMFYKKDIDFNNQIYISNMRHLEELKEADLSLNNVIQSVKEGMPEDLFTIDLMDAITHLSKILGEDVSEDLVNTIFSKFCMGK